MSGRYSRTGWQCPAKAGDRVSGFDSPRSQFSPTDNDEYYNGHAYERAHTRTKTHTHTHARTHT
jgi:hypothetical protein